MEHLNELSEELDDLIEKGTFLDREISNLEGATVDEIGFMYAQLYAMSSYADILKKRIELARELHK